MNTSPKVNRTDTYKGGKPLLHVSESKKKAKDYTHTKDVADFYISSTYFRDMGDNARDLHVLYDAYNNILPEEFFHYVTNPLNSTKEEHRSYPARIRPYSIIRPNIDLLLGEFDKRPKNYTVITSDSESLNHLEQQLYQITLENLQHLFIAEMKQKQNPNQNPNEQVELPEKLKEKFLTNYRDERAIWAQVSLEELDNDLKVNEVLADIFKDYLIAGEGYSYKGIHHERAIYERVSPLDIDFDKSPDERYVENSSWVVRRKFQTPSDIVAEHYEDLSETDIRNLESQSTITNAFTGTLQGNGRRKDEDLKRLKIAVFHVAWKYYKKIGFLTYLDELGEEQEIVVPEDYQVDKDRGESVEWVWVTTWWETTRIDIPSDNEKSSGDEKKTRSEYIYTRIREIPYQRNVTNNFSYCKGPFNGLRFSDTHTENTSIVELGMPYQILYIILKYRLELTIAKSKGKIALLDVNAIPKKDGWNEEKFFYWAEANNFAMLDRNQIGVDKSWNQYQVLDLGLYDHIDNLVKVIEYVKQEWDQLVGFTPQRKGQVAATETAAGIDAARYQSSVISERMFSKFDDFILREREGLLDLSKFLNREGKRKLHYGSDMRAQMLDIDGELYSESEYNIHITNSGEELENLNVMKQQAANFAAQGAKPSIIAEVVQAKNISKLKSILKVIENEEMEAAQQQMQTQAEADNRKLEIEQQYNQIKHEFDSLLQELKYDREERIEHIKGQYRLAENDFSPEDANIDLSPTDIEKNLIDREKARVAENTEKAKLRLEEKKQKDTKEIENKKLNMEKYKADKQLEVAKENKNQYDRKTK